MAEDYGRAEWREDAGAALAEAERRIAVAADTGADTLDFSDLTALTALPKGLGDLPSLRKLFAGYRRPDGAVTDYFGHQLTDIFVLDQAHNLTMLDLTSTGVTDLSVLSGLTALTELNLSHTGVTDLTALSGLTGLTALELIGTNVTDLSRLSGLTGLATLDLSATRVTDLSALSGFTGLATLYLSGTGMTDLSALANLTGLTALDLSGTRVTELSALSGLTELATLDLSHTRVTNLSALAGLTGLTELDLSHTRVTNLSTLAGLTGLTELDLSGTGVTELSALSGLIGLATLNLSATGVTDLSALSGLTGLTALHLSHTGVTDLSALSGLTGLTALDLSGTRVTDLSVLLRIPRFADETAEGLRNGGTPAANPQTNPHMSGLSNLPPKDCAIAVVRYLKGLPDQPTKIGQTPPTLAQSLAEASPIALTTRDGKLTAVNAGTPERLAPKELSIRLQALRVHLAALQEEAASKQLPAAIRQRFERYAVPLAEAEPTYLLLDGPMAVLKGGLRDKYTVEALDGGFVAGWRALVKMHSDLRPLLLPPDEPDDLPPLKPDTTAEMGQEIADQLVAIFDAPDARLAVDPSVIDAVKAAGEFFEAANLERSKKTTWIKRGVYVIGGLVSLIILGGAASDGLLQIGAWLTSSQGQYILTKLQPIFEFIKGLFV